MIPLCFSEMAPENLKDTDFCSIKKLTEKYEALFTAKLDRNNKTNLANFLHHFDDELRKWYLELKEKPDTWLKLKNQIQKTVNKRAIIETLKNKQKPSEPTLSWFEKSFKIIEGSWLNIEIAHALLNETTYDLETKCRIANYCAEYGELTNIRKNMWRIEMIENLAESIRIDDLRRKERRRKNLKTEQQQKIRKQLENHKEKTKTKNDNKEEQKSRNQNQIGTPYIRKEKIINQVETIKIPSDEITIDNEPQKVTLDTGSDINIISEIKTKTIGLAVEKTEKITLRNFNGIITTCENITKITFDYKGIILTSEFYVVNCQEQETIIIGKNTLAELNKKKDELEILKNKFEQVFDDKPSEGYKHFKCPIDTKPGKKVNIKYRSIPNALERQTKEAIDELLKKGYVEISSSSWTNPIKPVLKSNGKVRITSNMQFLNNLVEDNKYCIPHIRSIIEKTNGKKWFTVIDLKDGYFQILLEPKDKFKTAFHFKNQLYQWTRMPQGFKNSPAIFQMIMDKVLNHLIDIKCNVYLDDIIVYGSTEQEHDENLEIVLKRLQENKFKINLQKIQYKQNNIKLLGAIIDGVTQKPLGSKQRQILEFQEPQTKKQLQRYLGFINYYRKYIPNFAEIATPLYESLRTTSEIITWRSSQQEAFQKFKEAINKNIAIYIPDHSKEFYLSTDACNTGISAVLQQKVDNELRVIDWSSKKLSPAETKYTITEKEFLAVCWGVEHYDYYLKGRNFTIITDHIALKAIKDKEIFGNNKLERMRERLQQYEYTVEYKKGEELIEADTISRIHENTINYTEYELRNKRLVKNNEENYYWKINENEIREIPKIQERVEIIKKIHETDLLHRGRDQTVKEIKEKYYWPKLAQDVNEVINQCQTCSANAQKNRGGSELITTEKPKQICSADILFLDQETAILTYIDFYTRMARMKQLFNKSPEEIKTALSEIFNELGRPEILITDNGTEFTAEIIDKYLFDNEILHHVIPSEKHQANGRIERFHRTMWQYFRKLPNKENFNKRNLSKEIDLIIEAYNNAVHRGINMSPNQAWNFPANPRLLKTNSAISKYAKEFKKIKREKFELKDKVLIEETEMNRQTKLNDRYKKEAEIYKKLENDSYLVLSENYLKKKSHSQLKKLF